MVKTAMSMMFSYHLTNSLCEIKRKWPVGIHRSISGLVMSVCLLVMSVYCAKMADAIGLPFWVVDQVGQTNGVLDEGPAFPTGMDRFFGGGNGAAQCNVAHRETVGL